MAADSDPSTKASFCIPPIQNPRRPKIIPLLPISFSPFPKRTFGLKGSLGSWRLECQHIRRLPPFSTFLDTRITEPSLDKFQS
jgi:hypothetical protein